MVELDPNAGLLTPIGVSVGDALGSATADGFTPNGIPSDVSADPVMDRSGGNFADTDGVVNTSEAGTEGGTTAAAGINGSRARLPYGWIRPATRCWAAGARRAAAGDAPVGLVPAAGRLGHRPKAAPLLVVSAAGRFDQGEVQVQWATDQQAAAGKPGGALGFGDVGAAPAWRNLRAPLAAIPADATQIRLIAKDDDLAPQHWIAVTPPRIPSCARCSRWSACRTRCCWTGWSAWRSRASVRSATRTVSSNRPSGASCPTGSARRPTRR